MTEGTLTLEETIMKRIKDAAEAGHECTITLGELHSQELRGKIVRGVLSLMSTNYPGAYLAPD